MHQKLTFSLLGLGLALSLFAAPARAASPSPSVSASPSAAATDSATSTTDKLKERIDKVIEQQKDRVQGVMDNLGLKKRAIVGEVQRINEKNITVKASSGSHVFIVGSEISIFRDNRKATIDDIAVGDWVIAYGYQKGNDFTLRRFEVSSTSLQPVLPNILIGTLKTINKAKTIIEFSGRFDQTKHAFSLGKNTVYQDLRGTVINKEDLKLDSVYILLYPPATTGTPSATFIRSLAN